MKPQPSIFLLSALAVAGGLLHGCEGGISQIAPGESIDNTLIAAYVDPKTPAPGAFDGDRLPILDGDPQDRSGMRPAALRLCLGDKGNGGPGSYVELRASGPMTASSPGQQPDLPVVQATGSDFRHFSRLLALRAEGALGLIPSPIRRAKGRRPATASS
jgi:hypothetical protein